MRQLEAGLVPQTPMQVLSCDESVPLGAKVQQLHIAEIENSPSADAADCGTAQFEAAIQIGSIGEGSQATLLGVVSVIQAEESSAIPQHGAHAGALDHCVNAHIAAASLGSCAFEEMSEAPQELPCEELPLPAAEQTAVCTPGPRSRTKLMLPLPPNRGMVGEPDSPTHDVKLLQVSLPAPAAACQVAPGMSSRRTPAALRSGRQLPARLQALDDETVMPREVYSNMLKLGERARGRLGYGQHKLTFTGPEGAPILRIAA